MRNTKKVLFLIITTILIISSFSTVSFARGGGGSSGGSGGSSGGGAYSSSSSSSGASYNKGQSNGKSSPFSFIIFLGIALAMRKKESILCYFNVFYIKRKVLKAIKEINKGNSGYLYSNLYNDAHQAYFALQDAWTKRNIEICRNNLSLKLLEMYESKLEWMDVRHEINILKNIKLLQAIPISIKHFNDNSFDEVWFFIKGSMIDYTINENTCKILQGDKRNHSFIEFWQFKVDNQKWVLNKIMQSNEFDFNICEVYMENDKEVLYDSNNDKLK